MQDAPTATESPSFIGSQSPIQHVKRAGKEASERACVGAHALIVFVIIARVGTRFSVHDRERSAWRAHGDESENAGGAALPGSRAKRCEGQTGRKRWGD